MAIFAYAITALRSIMERDYTISGLTDIFELANTGRKRLNMGQISTYNVSNSFKQLCDNILVRLRYPIQQSQKSETYGYTLSCFEPTEKSFKRKDGRSFSRHGIWRNGDAEIDHLSALYCDVDNANNNKPTISRAEVQTKLDHLGLSYFGYTTYTHSREHEKFRVIIDTDRPMTRSEMLRLAVYVDWHIFGHQSDMSIYDPGDFLFGPPHHCETFQALDGVPLNVDPTLAALGVLQKQEPSCWTRVFERQQPAQRVKPMRTVRIDLDAHHTGKAMRPDIGIDNPRVFNPAWETLYADRVCGGHWETMRGLLGMIWTKTGGDLSFGELRHLVDQIDKTADGYLLRVHGEPKIVDLIAFIMSCVVNPLDDDRCSLLEHDDVELTIMVKQAECGQGKTHDELHRIARERNRYVYVVDKIDNMAKREEEFFAVAGAKTAISFFVRKAHSENPLRVPLQLVNIRKDLNALKSSASALVFVTQQAAAQMDWTYWSDFEIILDEVPDCFLSVSD